MSPSSSDLQEDSESLSYYGYLIAPDKGPTETLDALLTAVALHIVRETRRSDLIL